MSATVTFDIDGTPTLADRCSWFLIRPCGCTIGATRAQTDDRTLLTEAQAWKEYYVRAVDRIRMQVNGYRVEVGLDSRVKELLVKCTHLPDTEGTPA